MTLYHRHKFNAVAVKRDGIRFDSKKEAGYYDQLKIRVKMGEVHFFLRQSPIHLPGGVVMRIDFIEFRVDGTVHFIDVKGMRTKTYILKKRQVEALYPIVIEEV